MCLEYYTHSLNACDSSKTLMCLEYYTIEGKLLMCLEYYTIEVKLLCKNKLEKKKMEENPIPDIDY